MTNYLSFGKYLIVLSLLFSFITKSAFSQTITRNPDVITMLEGKKIDAIILEVNSNQVKYKKKNDPDGPTFTINKLDIQTILYGNGDIENFNESSLENEFQKVLDTIVRKDKPSIQGSVIEINDKYIRYRKSRSEQGPVFTVNRLDASKVIFANGEIDNLDGSPRELSKPESVISPPIEPGFYSKSESFVPTKNRFQADIVKMGSKELSTAYHYYNSKSKRGVAGGIVWTTLGIILPATGTILIATAYDIDVQTTGALLALGSFAICTPFAISSWVKAAKNGNKAKFVRKELLRRNQPLSIKISPQINIKNQAFAVALKATF